MKKIYILLCVVLVSTLSIQAQTKNKKGYYIDNSGVKKEGLIKDLDWGITPDSFTFYTSEGATEQTITLDQASIFVIENSSKYERHQVNIDQSSNKLNDLGRDRNPSMKIETAFLKVELEGALKLYSHTIVEGPRFFVQKEGDLIYPLIYKRFLTYDNKINENNYFQQQLAVDFSCEGLYFDTSTIKYQRDDIIKYVKKYNSCKGGDSKIIGKKEESNPFKLHFIAGANFNSLKIKDAGNRNFDFGSSVNPIIGLEIEYILPNSNNKWAAFFDGRYTSFSADGISSFDSVLTEVVFTQQVNADQRFFDVSIGARHYFFLTPSSKIHLGINYGLEIISNTDITYELSDDFISNGDGSLGLSAGYSWENFRGEIRYNTQKDHIKSKSEYTSMMLTLSYRFLQF